jgi:ubiquinone/menaquinone biosynthesis C-methylase UbiE
MIELASTTDDSADYWTDHNVTLHKSYSSPEESLDYFRWRNDQYVDYIDLLPVSDHDGEVIVDYGCGPGHDLVGFQTYSKPAKLYGMDVSPTSLSEAKERLTIHSYSCELVQLAADDQIIPQDSASVDYVHCSGVLMLLPNPNEALAEFHRVLRPGGYVRLMVYNYDSIWMHLYVAHILMTTDKRYAGLSREEAFRRSTDGFDCPISGNWRVPEMLEMGARAGFEARHLGNAISLYELSLLPQRYSAMMDLNLPKESREFLSRFIFDDRGIPFVDGQVAGIDGCYEFRKHQN